MGDRKKLGIYSSIGQVYNAISYYIKQPGFCDNPDAFLVVPYFVSDKVENKTVYEAEVYFHTEDYEFEESEFLGIFGEKQTAKRRILGFTVANLILFSHDKLVSEPIINKVILDDYSSNWAEGFIEYD